MKRVLTALVLIPLVLLVLFKAPYWLFSVFIGVITLWAVWEYLKLVDAYGVEAMKVTVLSFIAVFYLVISFGFGGQAILIGVLPVFFVFPLFLLAVAMGTDDISKALFRCTLSAFAIPYIMIPLMSVSLMRVMANGTFFILFLLLVVWSGDVSAYYVGRSVGRHKLAPRISPGKSWEGTVASLVGSAFVGHLLFVDRYQIMSRLFQWHLNSEAPRVSSLSHDEKVLIGISAAACVNIAAQLGDLAESLIKRGAGVKDSGSLLPGHGGILDRIDALLFAAPVAWVFALFFQWS